MMFLFIIYLQGVHLPPPPPPNEYTPPPPSLKDYEVQRAANLMRNIKVLASLGVPAISAELRNATQKKIKEKKRCKRMWMVIRNIIRTMRSIVKMILHKVQERCVIATYLIFSAYKDNNYKIQSYFLLIYTI